MGKGSKRRPISVPLAKFKANWDRVFKQIITTKDKKMLVLYTEKQLERAYKIFLADYEGTIVPNLEAFRIIFEASEELQELAVENRLERRVKNWKQVQYEKKVFGDNEMDYSGAFETDILKNTSIH